MKIELHPNGFLRLHKDEDEYGQKIHVFVNGLPSQQVYTGIHNHRFGFKSKVLLGKLEHRVYKVIECGAGTHKLWAPSSDPDHPGTLYCTDIEVAIILKHVQFLEPGETYSLDPYEYHEVRTDFAVTRFQKTVIHDEPPRVVVPRMIEPDNSFKRMVLDV